VRALVAARDVRVRRSLSRLLELDGCSVMGTTAVPSQLRRLAAELGPDLVVLELGRRSDPEDLRIVAGLARHGCAVIAVCSGSSSRAAVLAAGARACLDTDADFADRLTDAVRLLAARPRTAPPP